MLDGEPICKGSPWLTVDHAQPLLLWSTAQQTLEGGRTLVEVRAGGATCDRLIDMLVKLADQHRPESEKGQLPSLGLVAFSIARIIAKLYGIHLNHGYKITSAMCAWVNWCAFHPYIRSSYLIIPSCYVYTPSIRSSVPQGASAERYEDGQTGVSCARVPHLRACRKRWPCFYCRQRQRTSRRLRHGCARLMTRKHSEAFTAMLLISLAPTARYHLYMQSYILMISNSLN